MIREIALDHEQDKDSVRSMACWILANGGRHEDVLRLAGLLASPIESVRKDTAYALRWLPRLTPDASNCLVSAAACEPISSAARVYLLSAVYVHTDLATRSFVRAGLVQYALAGNGAQKSEVCHALAYGGDRNDVDLLRELLSDDALDVQISAANAILSILRKKP